MSRTLVIIGAGLSGLAAGIRFARFGQKVLILEKHSVPGGLNSYYYRKGNLFETGLHAMTNFAPAADRHAPLNRLFRQLKLSRKKFTTHEQFTSEVLFSGREKLCFSNDFELLQSQVAEKFPHAIDRFVDLVNLIDAYDPFTPVPKISTRERLKSVLQDELLIDMLLLPLMVYGNSEEHDMDFGQFVILFRAIFQEGFFRPHGTIKDFLDMLLDQYRSLGGEIRFNAAVSHFDISENSIRSVHLASGEDIECEYVISTAGYPLTLRFAGVPSEDEISPYEGRMSFVESLYLLPPETRKSLPDDRTILFYCRSDKFDYCRPDGPVGLDFGVICFSDNFTGLDKSGRFQVRLTSPANYDCWKQASPSEYTSMKREWSERIGNISSEIIGNYRENIVYHDFFTPVTIEKFTGKAKGAVYGSPVKIKDGRSSYENLFIAGTDQGYLGIVGAMLSGVTMVNHHILEKI